MTLIYRSHTSLPFAVTAHGCMETTEAQSIGFRIVTSLLTSGPTKDGIVTTRRCLRLSQYCWTHHNASRLTVLCGRPVTSANGILHALNVRTNRIHAVVSIGSIPPQRALSSFKANATRQMREDRCWPKDSSPWAEKGSKRYLWNELSIARAIDYVLYGQGDELPDFDD